MKIIEQAGFAHRRSRLAFDGSDRNSAACVAMNASRGFPPYSQCHFVSARSPVPASSNRVLVGADCMKKLRSNNAACGSCAAVYQRLDRCAQGRAQLAKGPDVREVSARYAGPLDPPPGLRVAIRRQQIFRRRRSGRCDGINEIQGNNRLAHHSEAPATRNANRHIAKYRY